MRKSDARMVLRRRVAGAILRLIGEGAAQSSLAGLRQRTPTLGVRCTPREIGELFGEVAREEAAFLRFRITN